MSYYNISTVLSSGSVSEATNNIGVSVLGGTVFFGLIILFLVFVVTFLTLKARGKQTPTSFAVSCWLVTLSAMLLRPIGYLTDGYWWMAILLTPIAVLIVYVSNRE